MFLCVQRRFLLLRNEFDGVLITPGLVITSRAGCGGSVEVAVDGVFLSVSCGCRGRAPLVGA